MTDPKRKSLSENLHELLRLYLTNVRLTATEKLSRLLTTLSIVFVLSLLGLGVLLFLSFSLAAFFSTFLPAGFAYMIVAGVYLILIVVVMIFRRQLFEDPATRLLSKIILNKPVHRKEVIKPEKTEQDEK